MTKSRVATLLAAVAALGLAAVAVPQPAQAWWRGGWGGGWGCCHVGVGIGLGFGVPGVIYAPPVYAPPPVVYAPPVVAYPPPYYYSQPAAPVAGDPPPPADTRVGATCYAGQYVCPLDHATAAGTQCSCPTETGRTYGRTG